ncbi:hypothetical protein [Flavobacterium bizetiae]|uniref:hypothetical protein n=1 Tax=Flavobacterium bizetiae TaxID=2704140 RepID=UPI00375653E0
MKTDTSIKNIVSAAIYRKVMNPEEWIYSKIHIGNQSVTFDLEDGELPIFEINSPNAKTIITTRRIIEIKNEVQTVYFEDIKNINYGNFKGKIDKPELSVFSIIDVSGRRYDFQMETGNASIGLINAVSTVLQLKGLKTEKFF